MSNSEATKKPAKVKPEKSTLESAAVAIGSAIGAIAVTTGIAHPSDAPPKAAKKAKLVKKGKSRLPRKEKKAAAKARGKKS